MPLSYTAPVWRGDRYSGCGVGDVTLLAAERVGHEGHVTAVDIDQASLSIAEARLRSHGYTTASFVNAPIGEYRPESPVDAVIGRHILIHCLDPLAVLRHPRAVLREGGIVVFQEFDFSRFPPSYPRLPYFDRFAPSSPTSSAAHGDMGARLHHLFVKAGFESPDCRGEFAIDGGSETAYCEWIAESLRSVLPAAHHGRRVRAKVVALLLDRLRIGGLFGLVVR